ncbi:protein of unknown function [Bradyrhizobium vignae]|uniref:Uncharacterized protein n=1 Tax=Bradyrhizobium vignae TaxID=1549949 RepID=A0A2U3PXF9_9BRAD|nr:protein of unknown function [Bradyrhizobium vignae]
MIRTLGAQKYAVLRAGFDYRQCRGGAACYAALPPLDRAKFIVWWPEGPIDEDERMAINSRGAQRGTLFLNVSSCLKRSG